MCFSFRSSLIAYILGMVSGVYALLNKQALLGCLIITYSQMQLSEALIWYGIDTGNKSLNSLGTSYGKYWLASHNIGIGIGIILSILFVSKRKLKKTDFLPLIVGIFLLIFVTLYYYLPDKENSTETYPLVSCPNRSCQELGNRLQWPYQTKWYFFSLFLSIIMIMIWIKPVKVKVTILFIFLSTMLGSYIYLRNVTYTSVWCFIAAILAPLLVLLTSFLIKNEKDEDILI